MGSQLIIAIVDTKPLIAGSLPPSECARPGLHEFLEQYVDKNPDRSELMIRVYPHYDIVIWSQTHWRWVFSGSAVFKLTRRWLETKLVELDMIGGVRGYKICFVADRTSMFPVSRTLG
jgi:ubiquitin-like domain-containing CTD phosphatase 1